MSPPTSRAATEVLAFLVKADLLLEITPPTGIAVPLRKTHPLRLRLHLPVPAIDEQDSQLAQLNSSGMQPCSATTVEHACARCQDQTSALHMSPQTVWSRRLRNMQVSRCKWSVNTSVQANTERHTRKETREMCSCWGRKKNKRERVVKEGLKEGVFFDTSEFMISS